MNNRSKQIRRDTLLLSKANGGYHYGGCFSCTEILIALYDHIINIEDKFILSKGHSCWPLYVLLRERGLDPALEGHPVRDEKNGIHCTTGSLGHGLPVGVGMAMAKKMKDDLGRIYVLMGDGECQEGTTWESILIAGKHGLNNLVVIVDYNKIQGSGLVKDILPIDVIIYTAKSAGWEVINIEDGHSVSSLVKSLKWEDTTRISPVLLIANTIKGKGISFMENKPEWHAKFPNKEEERKAFEELI